ncbi:hypothetical protein AB0D78_42270 [Streptomyces avermitilis]|uniref:hypothetical protein n=1 Tax=Streptomyces avermitilis TaxID=33903 RepID=UPI0034005FF7
MFVAITHESGSDHTPEFAEAAASAWVREVLLAAAEALTCTTVDILRSADLRDEAWARFRGDAAPSERGAAGTRIRSP